MKSLFYYLITAGLVLRVSLLSAMPNYNITATSTNLADHKNAPSEVSNINFSGDYNKKKITISWINPSDSDFDSVELIYFYGKKKPAIVQITEGKRSYTVKGSYEKIYNFTLKTKNKKGDYSAGVSKKIYFGNFNPGGLKQFKSFDENIVAMIAGKLKIKAKDNNLDKLTNEDFKSKFSNLEIIEGKLEINGVDKLTNLDAFSKLKKIGGKIYIAKNYHLTNFCGLKSLVDLDGTVQSNYKVEYNAYNPSLDDIKNKETCKK